VLDHVSLGVADLERSRQFYDAALRPLGLACAYLTSKTAALITAQFQIPTASSSQSR